MTTNYLLIVLFSLSVLTAGSYDIETKLYNYISNIADVIFMMSGYILFKVSPKNKDKTFDYLLNGIIMICLGSLVINVMDMNYTDKIWGKLFPVTCGGLFVFGLIHKYYGNTSRQ